jgi:hypothetical protein
MQSAGLDSDRTEAHPLSPPFDLAVIRQLQEHLAQHGKCDLLRGLSASELTILEAKFQFRFPLDLAAFLSAGVPVDPPKRSSASAADVPVPAEDRSSPFGWHNWHRLLRPDVVRQMWSSPDDDLDESDTVTCQLKWHAPPDPDDSDDEWRVAEGEQAAAPHTEQGDADTEQRYWKDRMRRGALEQFPLIPVLGHRMMPTVRCVRAMFPQCFIVTL